MAIIQTNELETSILLEFSLVYQIPKKKENVIPEFLKNSGARREF